MPFTHPPLAVMLLALVLLLLPACNPLTNTGTSSNPVPLPLDEASKVTGKVDPTEKGVVKLDVYNGSGWHIAWIDVEVVREADQQKRQYRAYYMVPVYENRTVKMGVTEVPQRFLKEMLKTNAPPFENSTFYVSSGDFLADVKTKEEYEVTFLSLNGYKEK